MKLLIITQKVDADDDLLGFFIDWVYEFSQKFEKVFVITLSKGRYSLPSNVFVYSLGKEDGNLKIARALNFYKFLFKLVPKSDGIFAHMSPVFALAAWPAAKIFRKRLILWYLHRSVSFKLRLAGKLCDYIVTASKESLNITSRKIIEVGHGVDTKKFETFRNWAEEPKRRWILSVGRISPIKNYETLIKAGAVLKNKNFDFKITIAGRPIMPGDNAYFSKLKKLVDEAGLQNNVEFAGFVPHSRIPDYYKKAMMVVNLTPRGGIDKAVLEAMSAGCIVFTSNTVFEKYLGDYSSDLIFDYQNPDDLAEKIAKINALSNDQKESISKFLVASVKEHHSLERVVRKISELYIASESSQSRKSLA